MARNKMEQEFSEKLNQREIKPSAAAWDRLDAMLSAAEAQPKVVTIKKSYKWLYVAAGFLGFLFIGTVFFSKDATVATPDAVVVTENVSAPEVKTPEAIDEVVSQTPQQEIASASDVKSEGNKIQSAPVRNVQKAVAQIEKQQIAENRVNENRRAQPVAESQSSKKIINQKTQFEPSIAVASNQNAEELLAAAQSKRDNSSANVRVNAKNLLLQVDNQAEEKLTLKQKALRALNKNYQQVKVAVANRNIEESH